MKEPTWYENSVFYGIDIRRYQDSNGDGFGDIPGLISRLDYLADLGITGLWILPIFDTPLQDNGYDIRDYYRVDPRIGTLEDYENLIQECKKRGIRIVMDLVMNHTSNTHPWFEAARRDPDSRYRGYYIWTENPPPPSEEMPPIFPGEEDSIWTRDAAAGAYYLHRFYHFQPDLLIANPAVQDEIFKAIDFWLAFGVSGFRIDAAPLMIETKGLPETRMKGDPHDLFRDIHTFTTRRLPDAVLLGEANVQMDQLDEFFGGGSEMNMLFNFLLGPHILLAIAKKDAHPLHDYLKDLLMPPEHDVWLNFLRNLDELSLEKMPPEQNELIYQAFAPEEDMKIYHRGIRRRITPMLSTGNVGIHREKVELAYSLMFSSPGVPILMYGDEIGMGDDLSLPARHSVRNPMQWNIQKNAGFSEADDLIAPVIADGPYGYQHVNVEAQQGDAGSLLHFMKRMIAAWKDGPEIGICPVEVVDTDPRDTRVVVHQYDPADGNYGGTHMIFFHNLSPDTVEVSAASKDEATANPEIRIGRGEIISSEEGRLSVRLPGYGYLWIQPAGT